jgi:chromosome segregation ATPase
MEAQTKKRHRRSAEERLADLEEKQRQTEMRLREQLAKIEQQKKSLQENPRAKREREAQRRSLMDRISRLVPDWEPTQIIAAVAEVRNRVGDNSHALKELESQGDALMQELKPRRGRRPRSAI